MPSTVSNSRYGMKVVCDIMQRSYNSSSSVKIKPRESVPDRTIFIPLAAYISENNAAPSMKSSSKVTSSINTYRYPPSSRHFKSWFKSLKCLLSCICKKAVRLRIASSISEIICRMSVVLPVRLSPYKIYTLSQVSPYT